MFERLKEDIRMIKERDPAAKNYVEIFLCYPGLHAIWLHRIAHSFYHRGWYTTARLISHVNRSLTGIEIHPGAQIGPGFFVDHGMGVVIGETAEIGESVTMYHGVTLGGTSWKKEKRHPTIGNQVVIGAAAIVLGPIMVGDGARIGANSVVVSPVPPGVTVVGVPGRTVEDRRETVFNLEHGRLPDPVTDALRAIIDNQSKLEERIKELENALKPETTSVHKSERD